MGFIWDIYGNYPLVMTISVCELENGPVESSLIYPAIKWWIFPYLCYVSLPEV